MPKQDVIEAQAIVKAALPNSTFKVELDNGHQALVYLSGKMKLNHIRILPGDQVTVYLSPYDLTRGRIVFRKK